MDKISTKKYQVIYADPPWSYGKPMYNGKTSVSSGAVEDHYPTMSIPQLKEWQGVIEAADTNCMLFMWAVWPKLDECIEVGKAWGFDYVQTAFIWEKQRVNPGYYTMTSTEPVLAFKKQKGKIPQPRGTRNERQLFSEKRREHSRKPAGIRDAIERMFPTQDKIELFARTAPVGWDVAGNEVDKFDEV